MLTVFYDGKCSICKREINYYQRIAPIDTFLWVDITVNTEVLQQLGINTKDGLRSLHAQDANGTVSQGLDAFILIWERIPRCKLLSYVFKLPVIYPLGKVIYKRFAEWRFKRMGYDKCDL